MHCGLEGFFTVCRTQCVWLSAMGGQLVHGTQSFQTRFKPLRGLSGVGGGQRGKMPSLTLLGTLTATSYKTQTLSSKFCWTHLAPTAALIRAKYPDNANVDLCCFQALCFGLEFIFDPESKQNWCQQPQHTFDVLVVHNVSVFSAKVSLSV